MNRYAILFGLVAVVAGLQAGLGREAAAPAAWPDSVPEAVRGAADQGRYWRATRLLEDHLLETPDTTPGTVLVAARLNAGWGNWPAVVELLEGRSWLDREDHGAGWVLLGRARIAAGDPAGGAEALSAHLEVASSGADDRGLVELRRGLALARAGRTEAALDAFDEAVALLPWFADWTHYLAAEAAAEAGDLAEVDRRLAAAGDAGSAHWRVRAAAALAAGDTMEAREAALAATRAGSRAERSEAWAELGRLRLAAGDTARGRTALLRAMDVRTSMGAVDAARLLAELDPGPEEWRSIGAVYRRHGNAPRAIEGYESYLDARVGTPAERAQARLELGRARYDAGRFRQAELGLLELVADHVADGIAAEALFLAARSQYRQGRSSDGQATFLRLAEGYPAAEAVTRGLYLVADLKHDDLELDGPDGARVYYRRAAEAAPDLNEAGLARMRLAGLEYVDGDYAGAAGIWEEYLRLHPEGRRAAQAAYWAARSYRHLGQDSLADARLRRVREVEPLSFYGMRAAELLGRPILDVPMADSPATDAEAEARVRAAIRGVDLLAELGRRDDLVYEVERLRRRFQGASGAGALAAEYALAEALNERGYTLTGIGMGWTLWERAGGWNPRLLRLVYPFPFRNLVVPEATDRGVDPYLMAGLIRRESAFSPVVVSGAGAIGLMQIVPQTGRSLARAAGLGEFQAELLTRPEVNIHLGTRFFAELTDRFGESLPLVLAAYNAGPTRAVAWRDLPEARDPELFTERVPYGETRDYIRNVLAHRAIYRALYPDVTGAGGG